MRKMMETVKRERKREGKCVRVDWRGGKMM
jgi:hypothetical protein